MSEVEYFGLKPCPFCGGIALEFGRTLTYIHCKSCGADGPELRRRGGADSFEQQKRLTYTWNDRKESTND